MRRRLFIGLALITALCLVGCSKPLSERVVGTWQFYEDDGTQRTDKLEFTLAPDGTGTMSSGGALKWEQYPNMQYVTITFNDDTGTMTMKLATDDTGALDIAGEKQPVRRKL